MARDEEDSEQAAANPRQAFALLGQEIRLDILLALLEDWHAVYTEPKTYAELMDAVGMEDSGKFNYHLGKLRGVYVRKVEDGYVPTASATALYRAVLAHRPTADTERQEFSVSLDCPLCGSSVTAVHERGFFSVDCTACDDWRGFTYPFPSNGFESRTGDEIAEAVKRRATHHVSLARSGQCSYCAGTTAVDVLADAIKTDEGHTVEISCDTCTFFVGVSLFFPLVYDARVGAALAELGVDIESHEWELPEPTTSLQSRDPLRATVEIESDEGTATIVVDRDLTVCSVTVNED